MKVEKTSLKEQVRDILFKKIISGKLEPGERLKIVPIAKELNISQAPVREAIQCLVTSGYLELKPNVGASVKVYTHKEIRDIYEMRKILELSSLESVSFDCMAASLDLKICLKGMKAAVKNKRFEAYTLNDTQFHRTFVKHSGNLKMLKIWDDLLVPAHVVSTISESNRTLDEVLALHVPIIEGLCRNDLKEAAKHIRHHYTFLEV